ncbi:RteC domain-containing protein [Marinilabilia sp.]|uniref:RteC domain-containing protein n=1 Tax=Marinilabilia sp. TaxID=2021252 RepID=UPI0025B8766C|nr:RteC domain-containing protein [Marinilabilia sp.]
MLTQLVEVKDELLSKLQLISSTNKLSQAIKSVGLILYYIEKIKSILNNDSFKSQNEEIYFFKEINPEIFHRLIYFNKVLKIESKHKVGGKKRQKKILKKEHEKISKFFRNNKDFCSYMRLKHTHFDAIYFIRNENVWINYFESFDYYSFAPLISTPHSIKASYLLGYDLLLDYINSKTSRLKNDQDFQTGTEKFNLKWTDSKTDLIELIYALHSKGCFNYGSAEIKEIATCFSEIFSIELGDFYRNFLEIKNRQNPTKLLTQLQEKLQNKIEEQDLL